MPISFFSSSVKSLSFSFAIPFSIASSVTSDNLTFPPSRLFNGFPSSPHIVPNGKCFNTVLFLSTSFVLYAVANTCSKCIIWRLSVKYNISSGFHLSILSAIVPKSVDAYINPPFVFSIITGGNFFPPVSFSVNGIIYAPLSSMAVLSFFHFSTRALVILSTVDSPYQTSKFAPKLSASSFAL